MNPFRQKEDNGGYRDYPEHVSTVFLGSVLFGIEWRAANDSNKASGSHPTVGRESQSHYFDKAKES